MTGNIHYQVVEMHAGAQLTGRLIHTSAQMALPPPSGDADQGKGKDTAARKKLAEAMA